MAGGSGGVNPARATFLKTLDSVLVGHYHKTSQHTEASMYGDVYKQLEEYLSRNITN